MPETGVRARILCLRYSRSGTTRRVAREAAARLRRAGYGVREAPLLPLLDLPYPLWLALSFLPGSRFPLASPPPPDLSGFDACLLALPKWTFSCPPANSLLARKALELPPTALVVTCGGWDQERYLRSLQKRLEGRGVPVLGALAIKRKAVESGHARRELDAFLGSCFPALRGDAGQPEKGRPA
jgi:hypothetical protein